MGIKLGDAIYTILSDPSLSKEDMIRKIIDEIGIRLANVMHGDLNWDRNYVNNFYRVPKSPIEVHSTGFYIKTTMMETNIPYDFIYDKVIYQAEKAQDGSLILREIGMTK